jgi:hypothetical protein
MVSFKGERAMFRSRSVTDFKIHTHRGKIIKVMIGLVEPMGGATWSGAPWWTEGAERLTLTFKTTQGGSKVIPAQLRSQSYNALVETNRNMINTPSWCWSAMTGVHPWIHQGIFKTKISDTNVKSDLTVSSSQKIQFWRWHVWNLTGSPTQ